MHTDGQIIEAMHKEHCYQGMVELYHAWFGIQHTYVCYNLETLYITEDLEAPLNEFTFRQFLSDDKIIEMMQAPTEWQHDHEILKAYSDGANDVLDKIRAEIWDLQYGDEEKSMTDENRADAYNNAITQVIDIIDKYKDRN